ncbi:MAG: hypothetical protein RR230_04695 [Oscillospiraceae bacterium]
MDYKKPYLVLFNAVSDALKEIDSHDYMRVRTILVTAQQEAEELYISAADVPESEM